MLATLVAPAAVTRNAAGASDQLTEYGATRQAWLSHHQIDPNPKLLRGCCFLPRQRDGTDRYFAVLYGDGTFAPPGRVFSFEMGFNPPISAAQARRVARREAPSDARVVAHARKRTCEQILYRSTKLRRALGYSTVLVELSRSGAGGRYTGVVEPHLHSGLLGLGLLTTSPRGRLQAPKQSSAMSASSAESCHPGSPEQVSRSRCNVGAGLAVGWRRRCRLSPKTRQLRARTRFQKRGDSSRSPAEGHMPRLRTDAGDTLRASRRIGRATFHRFPAWLLEPGDV